ncbi:cobalt-precorrin-6A reductase [Marinisporobacter balticus]|uniref:Precorrin-6A/cobalt-precorrin-6A reductase n=1 Tax=Marinisporobacter balticus TaxID=2018667 RepID=A0A4V2SCJ3_9FIRM|nr:cobalt-precorrin-6A reductase [Marinisporobacter balticus]TCO79490.1 precorrin-6A/cobalt-precorrin-6A reductase [Marinisporobacter balticus]
MIMILSGTKDGRELVKNLSERGYPLIVTTATSYGGSLIQKKEKCTIISNKLNKNEMETLIVEKGVKILIDATHPYAVEVSENAMKSCENKKITYMRYQREESKLEGYEKCYQYVSSYEEAVKHLSKIEGNIFLTTGSKTLEIFAKDLEKNRLFPRILPVSDMIKKCEDLGIKPSNIIAMQGPFSIEMNMEMIKKYKIDILVSKESGDIGGTLEKLEAARKMEVPVLLIRRPKVDYKNIFKNTLDVIDKVSEIYG